MQTDRQAVEKQAAAAFWTLASVVVVVPLALAPGLQFFDVTPKLLVLLAGACVVWVSLAVEGRVPSFGGQAGRFLGLLAALAAMGVLATIFSHNRVLSLVGSEWRRMGLPAWLACLAVAAAVPVVIGEDSARRRRLLTAWVLAAVAAATYSFAQYFGWDPWISSALYHIGEGEWQIVRPPATLGYVSYLAAFLLPAGFVSVGLAMSGTAARARLAWGAAAAALALALVISGSRGAWLGAAAGVVVLLACAKRRRPVLLGLLGVTALAAVFVLSPPGQRVRSRLRWFVEDPAGGARLLLWRDSLRMARAHPLLGTGLDTFELSFLKFHSLELARRDPDRYAESPHNVFLDYLTSAGLPAMLLFAALMGMALRNFGMSSRAVSSREAALEVALLAALVAGLVSAQFIADTIPTRLTLLLLAALSVSVPATTARLGARTVVAAVAVAGLALVVVFGVQLVRADRAVWRAMQAREGGDLDTLLRAGTAARYAFPWTGTYPFAYSRALGRVVIRSSLQPAQRGLLLALAEDSAQAALSHSGRPQMAQVHLASLYVLQGKAEQARAALEEAIRAAPAWYRPRWLLAALLAEQGRYVEAAAQAGAALDRGARRHPEIARQCLEIQQLSAR